MQHDVCDAASGADPAQASVCHENMCLLKKSHDFRPYDPSTCGAEVASGMHVRLPAACTFSHLQGLSTQMH